MPDANIENLLILQERDFRRREIEQELAAIPGEIRALEAKIAAEKGKLEASRERIRELEVKRKDLDHQMSAAEQQIVRYKNQQLQVKKNEEYQALTHEIDVTRGKIGELEEKGIEVLLQLDEEKQAVAEIEKGFRLVIGQLEEKIAALKAREENCRGALEQARGEVEEARSPLDRTFLSAYDRQSKVVRFPFVAAVVDRTCQGCHLRVSGGIETELRDPGKITTCDNCGRIVYSAR